MEYVLLIYDRESEDFDPALLKANREISLMPTTTATSVRIRDSETIITDGPFAETLEALGGIYLIEAKNLDEALVIAAHLPAAKTGTIEVRPVRKTT